MAIVESDPRRFSLAARGLLALAVVVAALRGWTYARSYRGLDYYQFWVVGQAVSRHLVVDVYTEDGRRRIGPEVLARLPAEDVSERLRSAVARREVLETYSTPFLYTVAGVFASGRYDRDHAGFVLLSLGCGLFGALAICRLLRFEPLSCAAAIALLGLAFAPFLSDLRVGNVNAIQLGLLAAFLGVRNLPRPALADPAAGAILGLGVMFKPNLGYVALMLAMAWALDRRLATLARVGAGGAAAAAAAIAASSLYFGTFRAWSSWFAAVRSIPDAIVGVKIGNFALARLLGDLFGVRAAPLLAAAAVGAMLVIAWASRRRGAAASLGNEIEPRSADRDVLLVGTGCMAYLLSAPLVWVHYFVFVVPLALFLLRPAGGRRDLFAPRRRLAAGVALLLLANRPLEAVIGQGHPAVVAVTSNAGALLLFALAMREMLRNPDA